jgi:hypothetical protein
MNPLSPNSPGNTATVSRQSSKDQEASNEEIAQIRSCYSESNLPENEIEELINLEIKKISSTSLTEDESKRLKELKDQHYHLVEEQRIALHTQS